MDVKRLEDIRDFIINEIDCGRIENEEEYYNEKLNIYYIRYRIIKYVDVMMVNCAEYTIDIINDVFKGVEIDNIEEVLSNKEINCIIITIPIEQDFKLLNRKRKLWMLKD